MIREMSEAGLTDQIIASRAGLDQGHVTRIRNGDRKNIRVATYEAISTAFLTWEADRLGNGDRSRKGTRHARQDRSH